MTDALSIKNCPFCGGAPEIREERHHAHGAPDIYYKIECSKCGCGTKSIGWMNYAEIEAKLISLWNSRHNKIEGE